mmetsp:Transcript_11948/g.34526  ORF Transcript_11948/g.34526 Transcript_11948/m.34526 type:complete len:1265 (-) Transcript_11948:28-3822(-)
MSQNTNSPDGISTPQQRNRMRRRSTSYRNKGTGLIDLESCELRLDFLSDGNFRPDDDDVDEHHGGLDGNRNCKSSSGSGNKGRFLGASTTTSNARLPSADSQQQQQHHGHSDTSPSSAITPTSNTSPTTGSVGVSIPPGMLRRAHSSRRLRRASDVSVGSANMNTVSMVPLVDFFRLDRSMSSGNLSRTSSVRSLGGRFFERRRRQRNKTMEKRRSRHKAMSAAGLHELRNRKEIRSVAILRWLVVIVWLATACTICFGFVKRQTERTEYEDFEFQYYTHAQQILSSFNAAIDKKLGAINTMANSFTTYAQYSNQRFPFITLPNFDVVGENTRVLADSHVIHWLPLVTDEDRPKWEEYALANRSHADEAYEREERVRQRQDQDIESTANSGGRLLQDSESLLPPGFENGAPPGFNVTTIKNPTLQDGTGYHPRLWIFGKEQDIPLPNNTGPYLPLWQRSPVNSAKQSVLNVDFSKLPFFHGMLDYLLEQDRPKGVVMNRAIIPPPKGAPLTEDTIRHSQFRHAKIVSNEPETRVAYPVYDDFDPETANLVGVLSASLHWNWYFVNILPSNAKGIICVLENTFGQVFAYRIDGASTTYLGVGDPLVNNSNNFIFEDMMVSSNSSTATGSQSREGRSHVELYSYTTMPLDNDFSSYTLRIYPTQDTYDVHKTDDPLVYTTLVASIFLLAAFVFLIYDFCVQKRQRLTMDKAIETAHKSAAAERELNEYIAHEVRNPLAAALSACSFVSYAVNEPTPLADELALKSVREDVNIIKSSLGFVNELLRSLLDLNRATDRRIRIRSKPINVLQDILKPVASMLFRHDNEFQVCVECTPHDLTIESDCLRLKQIMLNLGRDAAKFTQSGFIRLRADVVDLSIVGGHGKRVRLYVEDSGPGIPIMNRRHLFSKFQQSLEVVHQGCGIGLCLCKNLLDVMGGSIRLDEDYDSGIPDHPGARFVIDMNAEPLEAEDDQLLAEHAAHGTSKLGDDNKNTTMTKSGCSKWSEVIGESTEVDQSFLLTSTLSVYNGHKGSTDSSTKMDENDIDSAVIIGDGEEIKCSETIIPIQQKTPSSITVSLQTASLEKEPTQDEAGQEDAKPAALETKTSSPPPPPLLPAQNTTDETTEATLPESLSVLFVDDDRILRKLFCRSVKKAAPSWKVNEAGDGETAISMIDGHNSFDLIFMDQYMSSTEKKLLGTETVTELRSKGVSTKICGLSANDVENEFMQSGADSFMLKPMPTNVDALKRELKELLNDTTEGATNTKNNNIE